MAGFSTGAGIAIRERRIIIASPFNKHREPVKLDDGAVVDKTGVRHQIAGCGHWTGDGDTCRHGCGS